MEDIIILSSTKADLPAPGTAGKLRRVTDQSCGVWMDQGSQWFSLAGEVVNVKEFGAVGGDGTNQTSAIDTAIAAANAGGYILFFPPGTYHIQPDGLTNEVRCSIWGPNTILRSFPSIEGALLTINYLKSLGAGWRTLRLQGLFGNTAFSGLGTGLYIKGSEYSHFVVGSIRDLNRGIWLDGSPHNAHIAVNRFDIQTIFNCATGILLNSGADAGHQTEANRFNVEYIQGNTVTGIHLGSGQYTTAIDENVFDIVALEVNFVNADGIQVQAPGEHNHFFVRGIFGGESGTGKLVVAGGVNNRFFIPLVDYTKITDTGTGNQYIPSFTQRLSSVCLFVDPDIRTKVAPGTAYVPFGAAGAGAPFGGFSTGHWRQARVIVQGQGNEAGNGKGVDVFAGDAGTRLCQVLWNGSAVQKRIGAWTTIPAAWLAIDTPDLYVRVKGSSTTENISLSYVMLQLR